MNIIDALEKVNRMRSGGYSISDIIKFLKSINYSGYDAGEDLIVKHFPNDESLIVTTHDAYIVKKK